MSEKKKRNYKRKHQEDDKIRLTCQVCLKVFRDKNDLRRHGTIHTGDKPYNCGLCGKKFRLKCSLKLHMRIHTGVTPFSCDVCDKTFTQSSHLTWHKLQHSEAKKSKTIPCLQCGKLFGHKYYLNAHVRRFGGKCEKRRSTKHAVISDEAERRIWQMIEDQIRRILNQYLGNEPYKCEITSGTSKYRIDIQNDEQDNTTKSDDRGKDHLRTTNQSANEKQSNTDRAHKSVDGELETTETSISQSSTSEQDKGGENNISDECLDIDESRLNAHNDKFDQSKDTSPNDLFGCSGKLDVDASSNNDFCEESSVEMSDDNECFDDPNVNGDEKMETGNETESVTPEHGTKLSVAGMANDCKIISNQDGKLNRHDIMVTDSETDQILVYIKEEIDIGVETDNSYNTHVLPCEDDNQNSECSPGSKHGKVRSEHKLEGVNESIVNSDTVDDLSVLEMDHQNERGKNQQSDPVQEITTSVDHFGPRTRQNKSSDLALHAPSRNNASGDHNVRKRTNQNKGKIVQYPRSDDKFSEDKKSSNQNTKEDGVMEEKDLNELKSEGLDNRRRKKKYNFKCNECEKVFDKPYRLKIHARIHTGVKPYSCDVCSKAFHSLALLKQHIKVIHEPKQHACDKCGKRFRSADVLEHHLKKHLPRSTSYICDTCGNSYKTESRLKCHKKNKCDVMVNCEICGQEVRKSLYNARHHFRTHKQCKCEECGKSFSTMQLLRVHMRTHSGEKPFKCQTCGKCFSHLGVLYNHRLVHISERNHVCDQCGKSFVDASRLKSHSKIHGVRTIQECPVCGKVLLGKVTDHACKVADKKFQCDICGKKFYSKSSLNKHKRCVHSTDVYTCDVCGKKFKSEIYLNEHKPIHNPGYNTQFKCEQCGRGFFTKKDLKYHQTTHSNARPFQCDNCGKQFKHIKLLRNHMRIHGDKRFSCDLCDKSFYQTSNLYTHKRIHHPGGVKVE